MNIVLYVQRHEPGYVGTKRAPCCPHQDFLSFPFFSFALLSLALLSSPFRHTPLSMYTEIVYVLADTLLHALLGCSLPLCQEESGTTCRVHLTCH